MTVVGILHPGEMGAAVAAALRGSGETVLWTSAGRSRATAERAEQAGLEDAGEVADLCRRSEVLLSVCPPHAALDVAHSAAGFDGIYADANAVAPETARTIASLHERIVDGGVAGLFRLSIRELERVAGAERSAHRKGWRWIGDMEEIARSMAAQDLPTGFHEAAAEILRRTAEEK